MIMLKRTSAVVTTIMIMAFALTCSGCSGSSDDKEISGVESNAASLLISGLSSDIVAADKEQYDYTDTAMDYLEHIGKSLAVRDKGESDENGTEAVAEWITDELVKAGYSKEQIEIQEFEYDYDGTAKHTGHNIVLTVEGEDTSKQIIAGAHYDGDGVGDNGSGTALLLANAVGLADIKPHYTLKYVFFDAEEVGGYGSDYYAQNMTDEEVDGTLFMINLDSLAFGDYCNIYGGDLVKMEDDDPANDMTEGYDFAADTAEKLGFKVMRTEDLDGYFNDHSTGPEIEENTLYTNPWTDDNPSPSNYTVPSPATLPASDHLGFMDRGIEYIYFEATNWFAEGANDDVDATSYTGYVETYDYSIGEHGMFMNTKYDTWDNLNEYFPGRAENHFKIYSPLMSALLLAE